MDFRGFYDQIIFDVNKPILRKYTGKQGDTKSRGLYVTVTQRNVVIKDLTGLSMRLFYEKPDKTRGFIDGVVDGDKFRIDYTNQMFAVPGVVKAELRLMGANGEVITDKAFKISVDSSIADGSIISKDERGILDRAFELAEDIIPRLELLDVELLEDVQNEMLQSQLKVAKVEKELNDYKATMQQINIHQSPTQKASGHGIVSLPPNTAEGQISAILKGNTWTNRAGIGDTSPQTIENLDSAKTYLLIKTDGGTVNVDAVDTAVPAKITGKTSTVLTWASGKIALYELSTAEAALTEAQLGARYHYVSGTKSTVSAMRIRIVSEDEAEGSTAYVLAKDEDGNIEELRSLPNGTKDEIRVSGGKAELVKRVSDKVVLDGSEDWTKGSVALTETVSFRTPLSNMRDKGAISSNFAKYVTSGVSSDDTELLMALNGYLYIRILKTKLGTENVSGFKAWLQANPITLTYQLAEPIETHVQVFGSLVNYPSGTVYVEPFVADAGIYTDKMTVLHQDLPIKVLEKLSKIDYTTGLETELDVNDAVISEDKLSFTHPDLVDGDIVFYTYEYDRESTEGEIEIEYYDSRYVVKDSVTGKFYKWQITVADGVPSIELKEV